MSDVSDPKPGPAAPRKKGLPRNLIVLFVIIVLLCLYILVNMMRGIHVFNTFHPEEEPVAPSSPGFP